MKIHLLEDVKYHFYYRAGTEHTVKAQGPKGFALDDGTLVKLSQAKVIDPGLNRVNINCKDIERGRDYLWAKYIHGPGSFLLPDLADLDRQGWEVVTSTTKGDVYTHYTIRKPINRPALGNPVAEYDKLKSDSLDAIVEVMGEGNEFKVYNSGKSQMRQWFLRRLRGLWDLPEPVNDLGKEG